MKKYQYKGIALKNTAKALVLEFMQSHIDCSGKSDGLKQSDIFKLCGFDWEDKNKARSTQQQYWVIALLRELESEGHIEQVNESGPWRLKNKQGDTL